MAGSKGDKYYDIFLDFSIWLKNINNQEIVSEGCLILLSEIHNLGSIKLAAEKLGISYRKAWNMIADSESLLGFKLVEKIRGGKEGGHTSLSTEGENLINAYLELKEDIGLSIKKITKKFFHKINQKTD
jgi:molybdate transport system regulatory protein